MNTYSYANNNPLAFSDPSGLMLGGGGLCGVIASNPCNSSNHANNDAGGAKGVPKAAKSEPFTFSTVPQSPTCSMLPTACGVPPSSAPPSPAGDLYEALSSATAAKRMACEKTENCVGASITGTPDGPRVVLTVDDPPIAGDGSWFVGVQFFSARDYIDGANQVLHGETREGLRKMVLGAAEDVPGEMIKEGNNRWGEYGDHTPRSRGVTVAKTTLRSGARLFGWEVTVVATFADYAMDPAPGTWIVTTDPCHGKCVTAR